VAFQACVFGYLNNIFLMAIGAVPDPVRVLPFMVTPVAVYTRFFMRLMDDIHLIFGAPGGNYARQLGHVSGTLLFAGNKQGWNHYGNDAAHKEVCSVHYGCCSLKGLLFIPWGRLSTSQVQDHETNTVIQSNEL